MQNTLNKIEEFRNSDNITLHLLTRNNNKEYGFLTTELENNEIRQELINVVINQIETVLEKDDYSEEEYCPVTKYNSNTVEIIDINDINSFEEIINGFEGDLDCYNSGEMEDTRIWAYVIILGDNEIILFQKCQPSQVLKTTKRFKIIENEGHFSKLDSTILTIEPKMDCIVHENKLFVFNKFHFEEIFGIIDKFEAEIAEKISAIPQDHVLVDVDELMKFCLNDRNKTKKLYKILDHNGFEFLTRENVENLNESHELGLNIENGMIKLSPNDTRKVLNLMDEDYVNSTITDRPFVTHSKSPINRNPS